MSNPNQKRREGFNEGWYEPIRRTQEAKTWKDLAQAAYKKQLAPKKNAPEGALFKDNPSSKESLAKE